MMHIPICMNPMNTMCIEKSQPQMSIYHMTYDKKSKTDCDVVALNNKYLQGKKRKSK